MSDAGTTVGASRRGLLTGALLVLPRLVLAWFLGFDALQLLAAFLAIAGSVLVALGIFRLVVAARRGRALLAPALVGVLLVALGSVLAVVLGGAGYTVASAGGGTMPAKAALVQYGWTLTGLLWAIGAVLAIGSAAAAVRAPRVRT